MSSHSAWITLNICAYGAAIISIVEIVSEESELEESESMDINVSEKIEELGEGGES